MVADSDGDVDGIDGIEEPFSVRNQNPFVAVYGFPRRRGIGVLDLKTAESKLGYNVNSNYEQDRNLFGDAISLDGESEVWELT